MTISHLFVEEAVADNPEVQIVRSRLNVPESLVSCPQDVYRSVSQAPDPASEGKQALLLTRNRGAFVRDCPGTRNYTCCGYRILHVGTYCVMDCTYCILQAYFHPPVLQYFVNDQDMQKELHGLFSEPRISRVGTGEFTDSLIWERWTDLCPRLVREFADQDRAVLEFKTKTTAVDRILPLPHGNKTILSWSLNTERVIAEQERKTASLKKRLEAAAMAVSHGFPVAFHFDPMLIYPGCEQEYREVAQALFRRISAERIVWISLGTFRFMPALKAVVERRFPDSKIIYGEFVSGLDGKMRYFRPLRVQLYRKMADCIRELAPSVMLYLCMEDEKTWQQAMGISPAQTGGLQHMLDRRAAECCGLNSKWLS